MKICKHTCTIAYNIGIVEQKKAVLRMVVGGVRDGFVIC